MKDPRDNFPLPGIPGSQYGCGCLLPTSGVVLVLLTIALIWALGTKTQGWTPLWFLVTPLVAGIFALFVRIRWGK